MIKVASCAKCGRTLPVGAFSKGAKSCRTCVSYIPRRQPPLEVLERRERRVAAVLREQARLLYNEHHMSMGMLLTAHRAEFEMMVAYALAQEPDAENWRLPSWLSQHSVN